jgi:pSer/pThr/pTyr-binding forkhead associated (FHA) protein
MTTIIVTHEDNEVDEFEFESGHEVITIGRRSDNDVAIPNLSISGKHAKICLEDGQAFLEDLNSTNGSYLNGEVVKRKTVQSGDDIILGKIRLGIILAEAADVADLNANLDDDEVKQAVSNDDSLDFSVNKMASSDSLDSDEMSFDEDARLFAQSPSDTAEAAASELDGSSLDRSSLIGKEYSEDVGAVASDLDDDDGPIVTDFSSNNDSHPLEGLESKSLNGDDDAPPMHELDSAPVTSNGAVIEIKNGAKSGQILPIDKPVTTLGRPGIQIAAIMRKPDGYFLMHIESDDSVDRPTLNQDAIGDEPVLLHSGDELNVAGIDVEFMLS